MRLSEAIRLGALFVEEYREGWLKGDKCGCALGTAYLALGGSFDKAMADGGFASRDFGVPPVFILKAFPEYAPSTLSKISRRHYMGESRLSIADWLEREIEPALFPETKPEVVHEEVLAS